MMSLAYFALSFVLLVSAVVFPNAFQLFTAALLILLGYGGYFFFRPRVQAEIVVLAAVSITATVFYVSIGGFRGAPEVALLQALFVYVITPIAWALVASAALDRIKPQVLGTALTCLGLLSCASVAVYFMLFNASGASAVAFFNVRPNVHLESDWAAMTLHVPASLVFLSAGFFAAPTLVRSVVLRLVLMFGLLLATIATGRTAALVGLLIGVVIFAALNARRNLTMLMAGVICGGVLFVGAGFALNAWLGVDIYRAITRHYDHAIAFGGHARTSQVSALLAGAADTRYLGAGHGFGVPYTRSQVYPWRYEAVPLALLFKLGILGSVAVLAPLLLTAYKALSQLASERPSPLDVFFAAAFIASVFAALTNPYMEAFSLQWMFIAPMCHFLRRKGSRTKPGEAVNVKPLLPDAR
jgi:hypothetical protein